MVLKLFDNVFTLVGGLIITIILMVSVLFAFQHYPITTAVVIGLWVLALLLTIVDDVKKPKQPQLNRNKAAR